jgi:uncharacterized OB-fold protein
MGENTPTIAYDSPDQGMWQLWYRTCPKCGRFVKPDARTRIPEYQQDEPNATCAKCGRVQMPFAGWIEAIFEEEDNGD